MFLNFKEAFTYMFEDEKFWSKYTIGAAFVLLSILPIWYLYPKISKGTINPLLSFVLWLLTIFIGTFIYGFVAKYANSKIVTNENLLPDWIKDFPTIVKSGLKYIAGYFLFCVASFLMILPALIIIGIIGAIILGFVMAPTLATFGPNVSPDNPAFNAYIMDMTMKFLIVYFIVCLPIFITWIIFLVLSLISYLTDLKFVSFFNFKKMIALVKGNFWKLVTICAIGLLYGIITAVCQNFINYHIYFALTVIFSFYFSLVLYNLYAQFAKIGLQKIAQNDEVEKPQEIIEQDL